eukprot:CAMPEP_0184460544 /NCGR_PEP_ID=MMETSP0740-20130409/41013_1 /TAXON_ID=385413 /ORGANISM="Thalassiosira miniscula, Strain CCMP1093" /LENGTH=135 /DNA_ID=CAMNT_0026833889 /DNA_START=266 /DNA_END=674 /DNA_ORIENTATION=+
MTADPDIQRNADLSASAPLWTIAEVAASASSDAPPERLVARIQLGDRRLRHIRCVIDVYDLRFVENDICAVLSDDLLEHWDKRVVEINQRFALCQSQFLSGDLALTLKVICLARISFDLGHQSCVSANSLLSFTF